MSLVKGALKDLAKFTKKTPALESLFNIVTGFQTCNVIKETPAQAFSCEFAKFIRTRIL